LTYKKKYQSYDDDNHPSPLALALNAVASLVQSGACVDGGAGRLRRLDASSIENADTELALGVMNPKVKSFFVIFFDVNAM
jgi:hypothetical protein